MHFLDWTILGVYLVGVVVLSVYLGYRQHSAEDYFLAGRRIGTFFKCGPE